MAVNNIRSLDTVNPNEFTGNIHVIGAGMTGSKVVRQLIKLGYTNITAYDFDKVEAHNVGNQEYTEKHVGKPKVEALQEWMDEQYGIKIKAKNEKVTAETPLDGIVFLLTDTMSSRREIMEALYMNPKVKMVIETRVDVSMGYVNTINPVETSHMDFYMDSLFDDNEDTEVVSACGTRQVINHTGDIIAGCATWEMIKCLRDSEALGASHTIAVDPVYFVETRNLNEE